MSENALLGLLETGLGLGWVTLNRLLAARMEGMTEELGLLIRITTLALILAGVLGIGAVGLTPLVSTRKLHRTDIPSTLRVME